MTFVFHFMWILWTNGPEPSIHSTMINDVYIIFYLSYAISRIMFLLWRWLVRPILSLSTVGFDVLPRDSIPICSIEWFFIFHHFNRPVHNNYFSMIIAIATNRRNKIKSFKTVPLVAMPFNFSILIIFHKMKLMRSTGFFVIFFHQIKSM